MKPLSNQLSRNVKCETFSEKLLQETVPPYQQQVQFLSPRPVCFSLSFVCHEEAVAQRSSYPEITEGVSSLRRTPAKRQKANKVHQKIIVKVGWLDGWEILYI